MGRRQRDLDISGGPVAEFAALLRAAREAAGNPTFATMSRRAHRSISALSDAAGGVQFPTWATVEAFVNACGHEETGPWRESWETAQAAISRAPVPQPLPEAAEGVPAAGARAAVHEPDTAPGLPSVPASGGHATAEAAPLTPRHRPPRLPSRLRTLAALVLGVAVGVPVGTLLPRDAGQGAAAAAVPRPMPSVVVVPAPSPPPWAAAGSGCQARTHWVYQYTQTFTGQVYVQLAVPTAQSAEIPTTVTWGQWVWRHSVTVNPGDPAQAVGGTVLLFAKLDTGPRNPLVVVDTATPVCVTFGTAGGTSVAPLASVDANQGWVSSSPAPTG
ncbi:helix-turn-helix domain-containing protein [Kitasatospora mediocidica]|uniref:helix-turn-helix domain-containing protein n=1 Tax=Kitasatospora mediocidica TaxID=58352 RepID=UPI00068D5176|nr:helix-turn-helix domain-containing protein [Kitasatospora mediocidica]